MNPDFKKGFFGFGLGILLFYVAMYAFCKKEGEDVQPVQPAITKANVDTAMGAYKAAIADGADQGKLSELNDELAKQFGLRVKMLTDNTTVCVYDLSGKLVTI